MALGHVIVRLYIADLDVSGVPGTGKTATVKAVLRSLKQDEVIKLFNNYRIWIILMSLKLMV